MHRLIPLAALALLAGCATTGTTGDGTPVATVLIDTDKALSLAQISYKGIAPIAKAFINSPATPAADAHRIRGFADKARTALDHAELVRTSAAVNLAAAAITALSDATPAPKGN